MLTREEMRGVYVLPPTPFKREDGSFDAEALAHNVKALAAAGMSAVVTTGSLGEFHTISWPDHQRLAKTLAEECRKAGIVSVCGSSGVNTDEAIMKTHAAQEAGCDAVMNVSPYYVHLTRAELVKFWFDLAEACPKIGITIYNNPGTAQIHDVETYREIRKIKTLCGSKEAHYDFSLWYRLNREFPDLGLFTATEPEWVIPTLKMGARGIFTMAGAMIPRHIVKIYQACDKGQWDNAEKLVDTWMDMRNRLGKFDGWGQHVGSGLCRHKAIVNAFGVLRCGVSRRPFISVPQDVEDRLTEFVQKEFKDLIEA
jgi:4-hydroxy-tetrahydrodipicolinate synthase